MPCNPLTYERMDDRESTFVAEHLPYFTLHRYEPKRTAISKKIKKALDKITSGKEIDPMQQQ